MQILFIAIGIYFLYRFIFGFLIPVINTTSQVKKQFNAMREKVEEPHQRRNSSSDATRHKHSKSSLKTTSGKPGAKEDYIDFEEVRK